MRFPCRFSIVSNASIFRPLDEKNRQGEKERAHAGKNGKGEALGRFSKGGGPDGP